jgi:hypothetical protein
MSLFDVIMAAKKCDKVSEEEWLEKAKKDLDALGITESSWNLHMDFVSRDLTLEILKDLAWVEGYLDACGEEHEEFSSQCLKDRAIDISRELETIADCSDPKEVDARQLNTIFQLGYLNGNIQAEYHLHLSDEHKNNLSQVLSAIKKKLIKDWER